MSYKYSQCNCSSCSGKRKKTRKKVSKSHHFFFGNLNDDYYVDNDYSSSSISDSSFSDSSCNDSCSSGFCSHDSSSHNAGCSESSSHHPCPQKCHEEKPCVMPCIAHASLYRPDVLGAPTQFVSEEALVHYTVKGPEKCAQANTTTHSIRVLNNGDYNIAQALRLVGTFVGGIGGTPEISVRASIYVDGERDSTSTLVFNSDHGNGFDLTYSKPIQRFLHAGAIVEVRFHNVVLIPYTGGTAQVLVEDASLVLTQIDKGHHQKH